MLATRTRWPLMRDARFFKMEFGSILFHKMPQSFTENDRDELIQKLKVVLLEFGAALDEYEFADLPGKEYPISKCVRCGYLTLDSTVNPEGFGSGDICNAISRVVRQGE